MHLSISPGLTPGHQHFFFLGWQIPGVGTLELSNPPGWGRKQRANAPSSVNTTTFFIDRTVEQCHFKHFNVRFFVSINVFLCNSAILIKTSRRDDTSLWFFSIVIKLLTLKFLVRCKVNCYEQFYKYERMFFNNINRILIQ